MASAESASLDMSCEEFQQLLANYDPLIDSISASKGDKAGQKTLQELDRFRFVEAPALFSQDQPKRAMNHDDLKCLVDWKLRHGKFRPTLMKLVSSNDPSAVRETVKKAIDNYRDMADLSAALNILTKMKGIGPATASLILAVHYPQKVIFFSDEAYYWLCNRGQKALLKYNMKEYESLNSQAKKLLKRLGVGAMEVEKVAYVLLKQEGSDIPKPAPVGSAGSSVKTTSKPKHSAPAKRKKSGDDSLLSPFDTPSLLWSQSFPIALDSHPRGFMRADEVFTENGEPIPLPPRFAQIKRSLVAGKEYAIVQSWERLLVALRAEIAVIAVTKSDIIPTIEFSELQDHSRVSEFTARLRRRGGAVIRNVVPAAEAHAWREETETYLSENPHTKGWPTRDPHLFGIYWSPAQIKGRAHPNVLAAQRFLMGLWRPRDPNAPVVVDHPVAYADRLRIRTPGDEAWHLNAHVDGGSVERWESDGYGRAGTYQRIWDGRWEDYDPWDSSTRLRVTSDLYNGAGSCSMFRMFQGWLSMSDINPADGTLLLCPMLQLATAYFLLRPFFSPHNSSSTSPNFLARENWTLDFAQTSIIQGAVPSYTQELNSVLHPHLQLDKSLVRIPTVRPGDYVVWHPDMVYGVDRVPTESAAATIMYIPACPLTQTNALYLARQRKAFLLGQPSPDFGGGKGETTHMGRPGVQEVSDAGGEDGLRAMGLLPWEDKEGTRPTEKALIGMANAILFPESYDMV
ncbi:DUF1479-domain-containing protein [Colletotrichum falcatum]|nr:DUF1479-domain-containing protein [Colletotrichum falcatum]